VHNIQKIIILALKYALIASSPKAGILQLTRILNFFFLAFVAEIFKNKVIAAVNIIIINTFTLNRA